MRRSRWGRGRPSGGVAEIIGVTLLVALVIVAGAILWTFRIRTPPVPPSVNFLVRAGGSNPAWGDPTDCEPQGHWTYPLPTSEYTTWANEWYAQCYVGTSGNFTSLNTTEFIISGLSSNGIPLSDIELTFVCNGMLAPAPYTSDNTTVLVQGSLDSMIWYPGSTTQPAPDAPHLGWCGGFDAGDWSGIAGLTPANGTLYNRLGFFIPLTMGETLLHQGDIFTLYIHNGGYPLTYLCVAAAVGLYAPWDCPTGDAAVPQLDYDDYHGAPPWCFLSAEACTIYVAYTGNPSTLLFSIPVSSLAQAM